MADVSGFAWPFAANGHGADWIVREVAAEVPPPEPLLPGTLDRGNEGGLKTVTEAEPAALMSACGIVTVICVAEMVAAGAVN